MKSTLTVATLFALLTGGIASLVTGQSTSAPKPSHSHVSTVKPQTFRMQSLSQTLSVLTLTSNSAPIRKPTSIAPVVVIPTPTTTTIASVYVPPTTSPTVPVSATSNSGGYDHRWDAVAVCESGGWGRGTGGKYVGDLGILATNWYAYGGGNDTSPAGQVAVAQRIQSNPPDQGGCGGGW